MKAYHVYDRKGYSDYSVIVFAETPGKAIYSTLMHSEEFPKSDWDFTELRAKRMPALDKAYRGSWQLEWDNDDDRIAMIRDAGFYCSDDAFDPDECERCSGKDYCTRYEKYQEEEE